eukprot:TRINITY_DN42216_c0_g1_i1.p1 TRINITY_DN42216_c0_g1~~TRINITY_DN42216_c0_g1_i1.p1  ORF type:complete len:554 (+),score=114.46 TRINITY_DN42216_c0_g1_i1:236-1897(+)
MAPHEGHNSEEVLEYLAPLRAMATLLPEAADLCSDVSLQAAKRLDQREREALREFAVAGQRCFAKLQRSTLSELKRIGAAARAVERSCSNVRKHNSAKLGSDNVYEMFEQLDVNRDGTLSAKEFRAALKRLPGLKDLNDDEIDAVMRAVDVNDDGFIDLHEFTVWLYSKSKEAGDVRHRPAESDMKLLRSRLESAENELRVKTRALDQLEEVHEEQIEATHDFWRLVASNAVLTIDQKIDLSKSEWLGNGNYGFVLKAKRRRDGRDVVVKMMGLRWAHIAVQEWQSGLKIGPHTNIVEYEEVMLHADGDDTVEALIKRGYAQGTLKSRKKRTQFPDRFICLTQELMNRGTVQDWLNNDMLSPGGAFAVTQSIAGALGYIHHKGFAHNDVKPENVMLHQHVADRKKSTVLVKLGDLGLAKKSRDRSADFWQFGMTVFCMLTGEKYGERKYRPEDAKEIVTELSDACAAAIGIEPKIDAALKIVPDILNGILSEATSMSEVAALPVLQDWDFWEQSRLSLEKAPPEQLDSVNEAFKARLACGVGGIASTQVFTNV